MADGDAPDGIQALTLAGANIDELSKLSGAELTAAMKELGFKGLATRKRLEQSLKDWRDDAH